MHPVMTIDSTCLMCVFLQKDPGRNGARLSPDLHQDSEHQGQDSEQYQPNAAERLKCDKDSQTDHDGPDDNECFRITVTGIG